MPPYIHRPSTHHLLQMRIYPAVKASFKRGSTDPNAVQPFVSPDELTSVVNDYS